MVKTVRILMASAAILLGGQSAFAACGSGTPIFEDKFTDTLGGWDPDENFRIADGAVAMVIAKGIVSYSELNNAFLVRDADICVTATFPAAAVVGKTVDGKDNSVSIGIIFGALDYKNYYQMQISADGKYGLWRKADSRWIEIIKKADSAAIKTGFGARNQIEVEIKGGIATLFANGQKLGASRIQLPDGEARFGLYAELLDKGTADVPVKFQDFIVTKPAS